MHWFHEWKVVSQDSHAYFEKQTGQWDSRIIVPGTVFQCRKCPRTIIEPHDLKLQSVEVVKGDAESDDRSRN